MNTITSAGPAVQRSLRISLAAMPAAVAQARAVVTDAISLWEVPVDPQVAALLTSELVTNAIWHEEGDTIELFVTCSWGHLRVYVHDTSRTPPRRVSVSADAETGRGLMLVANLSTDWGYYWTPSGKAVYFTLGFGSDSVEYDKPGSPAVTAAMNGEQAARCGPSPQIRPGSRPAAGDRRGRSFRRGGSQRGFARDASPRVHVELLEDVRDMGRDGPP